MISAAVGCGACRPCLAGRVDLCEHGMPGCFGLGPTLQGCQAEAVRVPTADITLAPVPEGVSPEQAVMLTDNLPTAWFGAKRAAVAPGQDVAVVGLGAVGLMAVESAFALGAARVFAVDPVPERRALAESRGATAWGVEEAPMGVLQETRGRGVHAVIEAVGANDSITLALQLAGRDAHVSVVGVSHSMSLRFPMALAFLKGLTFHTGLCSVPAYWPELVPLVQAGRLAAERAVTDVLPLAEGAEAYRRFAARETGVLKVLLDPTA